MNCIIVDDDELTLRLMEKLVLKTKFLHLVKKCRSAAEASNILNRKKIDLIFLDILMPGMTGIELLKTLMVPKPLVIVITSDKGYAAEAFDHDVCDFIVKPTEPHRFLKAVFKAKKMHDLNNNQDTNNAVFICINSTLISLNPKDIFLIEALLDHVAIHTFKEKYIVASSMKNMLSRLSSYDFVRVHNSYAVRRDKITSIEENKLVVNERSVPIRRGYRKILLNRLNVL